MLYKDFGNIKISALAMGCMRLPSPNNGDLPINEDETEKMVDYAITHGVNYFDTAYGYHNGESEILMGKLLKKYPRKDYYLADKYPGYDPANLTDMKKVEEVFAEQLKKCDVDYFDFYLLHNMYEKNVDKYMEMGIIPYLLEQKELGKIKHLGFSVHGSLEVMEKFLEVYADKMEFCQIQLNYLDWDFQNARKKVELLNKYNIPIWVMEPMRGGSLASMDENNSKRLKALRPDESIAGWAMRFLQSIPGVTVVLTGASSLEQMKENVGLFEEELPLNDEEFRTIVEIANGRVNENTLSCTACRYCVSHCPKELNIPRLLELYNEHKFTGGGFIAPMALSALPKDKRPWSCVACGSCEAVCPQQLKISEALKDFTEMLKH